MKRIGKIVFVLCVIILLSSISFFVSCHQNEVSNPPPAQIEVKRKPTALPQGVYEDILMDSETGLTIDYYLDDEFVLSYSQKLMNTQVKYDNVNTSITEIVLNGHCGILIEYQNNPIKFIEWTDGEYRYELMSEVYGKDQLIALAESVT